METQIYGQRFNIESSFVNIDIENSPQFLPLKYSAIEYIEITDNISSPALSGHAVLGNYQDLINSGATFFDFAKLYNNLFNFKAEQYISTNNIIAFDSTFVLTKINTFPESDINNKFIIYFDDSFFGTLRNKMVNDVSNVSRYKEGLTSDIIRNILNDYNKNSQQSIVGDWTDSSFPVNLQFNNRATIFDIFELAYYNNVTTTTGTPDNAVSNILKDNGDAFNRTRTQLKLEPINQKFLALYRALQDSANPNLSDIVMEGISEAGADPSDNKTLQFKGYSEADMVQIYQPDPEVVRDLYRNIEIEMVNGSGNVSLAVLPIQRSFDNFYRLFCNNHNYKLDIPYNATVTDATPARDAVKFSAFYPELEPSITQAKLYNTILFNSKLLRFKVKGQVYRQPGYFIYFQPRRRTSKDPHYDKNVGFWYVTEVKHIFEGNKYDNIVTCVNPFVLNN